MLLCEYTVLNLLRPYLFPELLNNSISVVAGSFLCWSCFGYIRELNLYRDWLVNPALVLGVSWVDMHKLANKEMLSSMKDSGILTGDIEYMMKVWLACTLFLTFHSIFFQNHYIWTTKIRNLVYSIKLK